MGDANSDETRVYTDGYKTGKPGRRMGCRLRIRQIRARRRETPQRPPRTDTRPQRAALIEPRALMGRYK
jgi:hypothetical protein